MEDKENEFTQNLKSKNWKIRNQAYQDLYKEFKQNKYLNLITFFQHETMIPALECALDTLLVVQKLNPINIKKIFTHIGNTKNTIKTRMFKLITNLNPDEMSIVLCEYVKHTSPKIACAAVQYLIIIVENVKDHTHICNLLGTIFNHSDCAIRQEGYKLTAELYKIKGNAIKQYLINLKPIQLKELEEMFVKDEVVEINVNYENINCEKWNIRLEALKDLHKLLQTNKEYTHDLLMPSIIERLNDPNNQVFLLTCDILQLLPNLNNSKIYNLLIDKLKDKKVQITDKIKETLIKLNLNTIQNVYWKSKSPEIKYHLIDLCIKLNLKQYKKNINDLMKDSNKDVRTIASEAFKKFKNLQENGDHNEKSECINNDKNSKIIESFYQNKETLNSKCKDFSHISVSNSNNSIAKETKIINNNLQNIKNSFIKNKNLLNNSNEKSLSKDDNIKEMFLNKYPFFNEKNWSIRMENIKNNEKFLLKENFNDLALFFYLYKDPNFLLNIEYFKILLKLINNFNNKNIFIIKYCFEKCTESKLKVIILEVLNKLDNDLVVEKIIEELSKNKQGKKVVELLKILSVYNVKSIYTDQIKKIQVIGLQEKKAYDELIKTLEKNINIDENNKNIKNNKDFYENNESINEEDSQIKNLNNKNINIDNMQKNEQYNISDNLSQIKNNNSEILNNNYLINSESKKKDEYIKNTNKKNSMCFSKKEIHVTPVKTNKIFNNEIDMINYYIKNNLQSSYFNSLLLELISNKYILDYNICYSLVQHLIKESYFEELDMMDRVYPVTKLYLVLRNIGTDASTRIIINLVNKFKMVKKIFSFEEAKEKIKECEDFLSLVDCLNNKKKDTFEFNHDENLIESSIGNLSITPVQKKYKTTSENLYKDIIEKNHNQNFINENEIHNNANNHNSVKNISNLKSIKNDEGNKNIKNKISIYHKTNLLQKHDVNVINNKNYTNTIQNNNTNNINLAKPMQNNKTNKKNYSDLLKEERNLDFTNELRNNDTMINFSNNNKIDNINFNRKNYINNKITALENILDNIIDTDQNKSEDAFNKLLELDLSSIINYSNSIMSSISIQLLDVLHRPLYCELILKVLLRFSKNKEFMNQLRKETFESVTIDLVNILKHNDLVSEILINMCINCNCLTVLNGYLSILNIDSNIILKLIWKHSKVIKYTKENTRDILNILEKWYRKNVYCDIMENQTTFKICIVHLREMCNFFGKLIYEFDINGYCKIIIDRILTGNDININVLRC